MQSMGKHIKVEVYIPDEYTDRLREALNAAGLLRVGRYDNTVSVQAVTGYWRPLEGATPHEGTVGEITSAPEAKVEFRCRRDHMHLAVSVIRSVHPYEEPVIHLIPLIDL